MSWNSEARPPRAERDVKVVVMGKKERRAPAVIGDVNTSAEIVVAAAASVGGGTVKSAAGAPLKGLFCCSQSGGRGIGTTESGWAGHYVGMTSHAGPYYRGTFGGLVTDTRLSDPSLSDTSSDSPGRV